MYFIFPSSLEKLHKLSGQCGPAFNTLGLRSVFLRSGPFTFACQLLRGRNNNKYCGINVHDEKYITWLYTAALLLCIPGWQFGQSFELWYLCHILLICWSDFSLHIDLLFQTRNKIFQGKQNFVVFSFACETCLFLANLIETKKKKKIRFFFGAIIKKKKTGLKIEFLRAKKKKKGKSSADSTNISLGPFSNRKNQ